MCTACKMTNPTDFCDTKPEAKQDVVETATPCHTRAGHSGGALWFKSSPFTVRGLLSGGSDYNDEWTPIDVMHLSILFRTSSPTTMWGHTCKSIPFKLLLASMKVIVTWQVTSSIYRSLSLLSSG